MSLVHNERTKLTATAVSNLGLAFGVAGFVAPAVSFSFGFAAAPEGSAVALAVSLTWLSTGVVIPVVARLILRSLRE